MGLRRGRRPTLTRTLTLTPDTKPNRNGRETRRDSDFSLLFRIVDHDIRTTIVFPPYTKSEYFFHEKIEPFLSLLGMLYETAHTAKHTARHSTALHGRARNAALQSRARLGVTCEKNEENKWLQ